MKMLTEYYKFHNDIPRMFMLPTTICLNKFHDKKRKIQYLKITKMLKLEEKNEVLEKSIKDHYISINNKVLVDLEEYSEFKNKINNTSTKTI
jgi:hypothetical protein